MHQIEPALPNGSAAAALLAAGIGCFALGLLATLATISTSIGQTLVFAESVGALSGQTTVALVVWLVSWAVLRSKWKQRQVNFANVFRATLVLVALGLLGTFPPFYEALA